MDAPTQAGSTLPVFASSPVGVSIATILAGLTPLAFLIQLKISLIGPFIDRFDPVPRIASMMIVEVMRRCLSVLYPVSSDDVMDG